MKPLVIAGNSLLRIARDRPTLFFALVFPVLLIFVIGSASSRFDDPTFPVGVVDEGSGTLGAELLRSMEREPTLEIEMHDDREALAKLVRRGAVAAGMVLPASYDEDLSSGRATRVEFLVDQTRGFPAAVRSVVSEIVSAQGATLQAATFAARRTGLGIDESIAAARATAEVIESVAVGVDAETIGAPEERTYLPPGVGYQAPSNLILFVFITSITGSALIIQSRQLRVTHRILGTPTRARSILLGETLARFVIAGFQALFIFLVGTFLFGVTWGSAPGAVAVIVLFVLVGTSVGMLFGTVFRTPEQAGAIGAPVGIAAGMLGGCMWPLEIVPESMQRLGHVFPHAWAMDAWIELIGRGRGVGDILTELAVLAGFVAVLFPLAAWRLRRTITA